MKNLRPNNSCGSALENAMPLLCCLAFGVLLAILIHNNGQQHQRDISDLRKELGTMNAGQVALGKDVGEIRDLLRRQPIQAAPGQQQPQPQRDVVLSLGNAPFRGKADATVTLVEFTDYECGFCARHVKETMPQIERDYIATGKVKYVFRNFPLESIHQQTFKAHEAATCAADQNKFWEMHDRIFSSQPALSPAQLVDYAKAVGLNSEKFQTCFNAESHKQQIQDDVNEGTKAGVTGTPTFFLGRTVPNSPTLKVAQTLVGAKPYSAFKEAIDALLANPPSS